MVDTYNARYEDGSWAHGGSASRIRAHKYFGFRIPDKLETETVAPLLGAGITTYSPLVRAGVGPGKAVGVIGIGGLGHFGGEWAKAFGAETYAFTTMPDKVEDCKKFGAKDVIVNTKDESWADPWKFNVVFGRFVSILKESHLGI